MFLLSEVPLDTQNSYMLTALDGGQDLNLDTLCPLAEGILQRTSSSNVYEKFTYADGSSRWTGAESGHVPLVRGGRVPGDGFS